MRYLPGILFFSIAALPFLYILGQEETGPLPAAADAKVLSILSPHNREVRAEYSEQFSVYMREVHSKEVTIRWLDAGGTSKMLKDMESRFKNTPDAPGVDLLFGGGTDPYLQAAEKGWLVPVAVDAGRLKAIPSRCAGIPTYDSEKRWFGIALSGFGILYSRPLLEMMELPEPRTWLDLADPAFFSWVGSGDPRSSGSVHMCYEIILQACGYEKGWRLIVRLCANVRRFGESGGTVPREVAAGDIAAGMVISQYAYKVIRSVGGGKLAFSLPEGLTLIGPDAIGSVRNAGKPELAATFIRFALSDRGQRLLYREAGEGKQKRTLYRMPVVESHYGTSGLENPYASGSEFTYNSKAGGRRWGVVNDLIGVALVDAHGPLSRAWKAVIDAGCPEDLVQALTAPLVDEKELFRLADRWRENELREATRTQWARSVRERYRAVQEKAERTPPHGRSGH